MAFEAAVTLPHVCPSAARRLGGWRLAATTQPVTCLLLFSYASFLLCFGLVLHGNNNTHLPNTVFIVHTPSNQARTPSPSAIG